MTAEAVMHGTPTAPCVAGWRAITEPQRGMNVVAIIAGDMSGWLVRSKPKSSFAYRNMRCRLSPAAAAPAWVEGRQGVR